MALLSGMSNIRLCSRDDCPRSNVSIDTTAKCSQCKHIVHLLCIGINVKFAEINSPNIKILCQKCVTATEPQMPTAELNASFGKTSTPKSEKTTIRAIMGEVKMLRDLIEANGTKLDTIDKKADVIVNRTESMTEIASKPSTQMQTQHTDFRTPRTMISGKKQIATPKNTFANALKSNGLPSAKRQRTEKPPQMKFTETKPTAKVGTRQSAGLSVVAKPKRPEKPSFSKAIWISRLTPTETTENITEYIVSNTSVTDKSKFTVHKLVKKDRELSTLRFVSFKIEVNQDEFDVLIKEDIWPEEVMVREFLKTKTLGDHFPALIGKVNSEKNAIENDSEKIIVEEKNRSSSLVMMDSEL